MNFFLKTGEKTKHAFVEIDAKFEYFVLLVYKLRARRHLRHHPVQLPHFIHKETEA